MLTNLRNRIARRLEPEAWGARGTVGDSVAYENRRKASLRKTLAVLEAMREPSPAMFEAVRRELGDAAAAEAHRVWPQMIAALLAEAEEDPHGRASRS